MTDENKDLLNEMTDSAMSIMRNGVLFKGISEGAWELISEIQEDANKLKGKILDLEKIVR